MRTSTSRTAKQKWPRRGASRMAETTGIGLLMALGVALVLITAPVLGQGPIGSAPVRDRQVLPVISSSPRGDEVSDRMRATTLTIQTMDIAPEPQPVPVKAATGTSDATISTTPSGSGGLMRDWLMRKAVAAERYGFLQRMTELARNRGRTPP